MEEERESGGLLALLQRAFLLCHEAIVISITFLLTIFVDFVLAFFSLPKECVRA